MDQQNRRWFLRTAGIIAGAAALPGTTVGTSSNESDSHETADPNVEPDGIDYDDSDNASHSDSRGGREAELTATMEGTWTQGWTSTYFQHTGGGVEVTWTGTPKTVEVNRNVTTAGIGVEIKEISISDDQHVTGGFTRLEGDDRAVLDETYSGSDVDDLGGIAYFDTKTLTHKGSLQNGDLTFTKVYDELSARVDYGDGTIFNLGVNLECNSTPW